MLTKEDLQAIKELLEPMKSQLDENTQILRALREHSEVNKAEHDAMKIDMAHMMGDIVGLKESINVIEKATAYNWGQIADIKADLKIAK